MPPLGTEIVKGSDNVKGFVVLPRRAPSPGYDATGVAPETSRIVPKPWAPSLPSRPFSLLSGGLPGRRSPTRQTAGLHGTTAKVCKPDCEGTIAATRGNGEVAPKAAICARRNELAGSIQSWHSSSGARWLIVPVGHQLIGGSLSQQLTQREMGHKDASDWAACVGWARTRSLLIRAWAPEPPLWLARNRLFKDGGSTGLREGRRRPPSEPQRLLIMQL